MPKFQKILDIVFFLFTFSASCKKICVSMVDINSKSEKCEFGFGMPKTIKITVSQLVREKFPDLLENLAEEEFLLLLDPTKAKKKFKLHSNIPFLLPEGELTENERKHYFSNLTINRRNGSRYVLTSQWYSDQRDCVLRWGLAHSCKELKPFVEKLEKETLRAKSSLFSDFRKKTPIEKNLRTVFEKVVQECEDAFSRKGHGRRVCKAQKPMCETCTLKECCKAYNGQKKEPKR